MHLQTSSALGENLFSPFERDQSIVWVQNGALDLCGARVDYDISEARTFISVMRGWGLVVKPAPYTRAQQESSFIKQGTGLAAASGV